MYPQNYRYTKNHEWIAVEGSIVTLGITDYAQRQLGDVVFIGLPKVGAQLKAGEALGSIESVKSVNDLFSPVSGEVTEINAALADSPDLVNKDPHGAAWFLKFRVSGSADISALMNADAYDKYTEELEK
ncbi:MAG: glycine cleavage system protein GcvH [Candidatus Acidiferrales bacterium]